MQYITAVCAPFAIIPTDLFFANMTEFGLTGLITAQK